MALGGCLFVAVAIVSNLNSFLATSSAAVFGMLAAPFAKSVTESRRLRIFLAVGGIVAFMGTALLIASGLFDANQIAGHDAERMGQLVVYALIALLLGMYWLVKGWGLALAGINVDAAGLTQETQAAKPKGTLWLYLLLFTGATLLTFLVASLAFSAFSDSTFALELKTNGTPPSPVSPVIGLMFLASWPYACWKSILARQPNNNLKALRLHKVVTGIIGGMFATVLCVAVTFGVQNGSDRRATAEIEKATKGFQDVAAKIGAIKSRDLKTTEDYIDSYEEMEPLLTDFDAKLKQFTDTISAVEQRDRARGPLNIQRLYAKHNEWLVWDGKTFALLRQDSELTRRQIQVVKQMAELPLGSQVEYWKENFQPLQQDEEVLREKLAAAQKNIPK
jgi:hypothetical protein